MTSRSASAWVVLLTAAVTLTGCGGGKAQAWNVQAKTSLTNMEASYKVISDAFAQHDPVHEIQSDCKKAVKRLNKVSDAVQVVSDTPNSIDANGTVRHGPVTIWILMRQAVTDATPQMNACADGILLDSSGADYGLVIGSIDVRSAVNNLYDWNKAIQAIDAYDHGANLPDG